MNDLLEFYKLFHIGKEWPRVEISDTNSKWEKLWFVYFKKNLLIRGSPSILAENTISSYCDKCMAVPIAKNVCTMPWVTYFYLFIFLLYNIVLVLPYINMHPPQVYTCSPSWTPLPPPFPYHPSGSSQCTIPKLPVSCIEPGLAIHFLYAIIHVLMPFSQIITPPSPTESKRLFYTSVSLESPLDCKEIKPVIYK